MSDEPFVFECFNDDGGKLEIFSVNGRGVIFLDENPRDNLADCMSGFLPSDPAEVEAFVRAILLVTGCELTYSSSRTDFASQGRFGGVRVVKRDA